MRWRDLIEETGAVTQLEQMIESRVTTAWACLDSAALAGARLDAFVLTALHDLAIRATDRIR
jgi:hypothetical protein